MTKASTESVSASESSKSANAYTVFEAWLQRVARWRPEDTLGMKIQIAAATAEAEAASPLADAISSITRTSTRAATSHPDDSTADAATAALADLRINDNNDSDSDKDAAVLLDRGIVAARDIVIRARAQPVTPPATTIANAPHSLEKPSAPLIAVPLSLLITPDKIRASSFAQALLPHPSTAVHSVNASQWLCLFLMYHRRLGERSPFWPYIALLPASYTCMEWWRADELALLQYPPVAQLHASYAARFAELHHEWTDLNERIRARHSHLREKEENDDALASSRLPSNNCHFPLHMQAFDPSALVVNSDASSSTPLSTMDAVTAATAATPITHLFTFAEYQWAHSTVTTRSCFLPASATKSSSSSSSSSSSMCLIPFLDMLNHSSGVQAECALDASTRQYHLFVTHKQHPRLPARACANNRSGASAASDSDTVSSSASSLATPPLLYVRRGDPVFISYGSLDSLTLLLRYGFVMPDNRDDTVPFTLLELERFLLDWDVGTLPARTPAFAAAAAKRSCPCGQATIAELPTCSKGSDARVGPAGSTCSCVHCFRAAVAPASLAQLEALRVCGLYEVEQSLREMYADENRAAAFAVAALRRESAKTSVADPKSPGSLLLRFESCAVPWNVLTYLKVRTMEEEVEEEEEEEREEGVEEEETRQEHGEEEQASVRGGSAAVHVVAPVVMAPGVARARALPCVVGAGGGGGGTVSPLLRTAPHRPLPALRREPNHVQIGKQQRRYDSIATILNDGWLGRRHAARVHHLIDGFAQWLLCARFDQRPSSSPLFSPCARLLAQTYRHEQRRLLLSLRSHRFHSPEQQQQQRHESA